MAFKSATFRNSLTSCLSGTNNFIRFSDILDPSKGFLDAEGALHLEVELEIEKRTESKKNWMDERGAAPELPAFVK